jgi:hypothetical protein
MDQRSNSKLSLFLMELIVAILFFSLAAAVCVSLFSSAHIMADSTENLSSATMWSQNLSEVFMGKSGNLAEISTLYPEGFVTYATDDPSLKNGTLVLFFDENWNTLNNSLTTASYEAILETKILDAKEVYADVNDYNVELVGIASVGKIAILDIRNVSDVISEIPESDDNIILRSSVDAYLGKEVH